MSAEIFKFINNLNPWAKARLDEFLQYVCPECDFKCFSKTVFSSHALDNHINSRECLELKIKAEMDTLEGQLTGLMTKSENDSLHKSWKQLNIDKVTK